MEIYSKPCQIYKIECFAEIVNGFKALAIFPKHSILDVSCYSKYVFEGIRLKASNENFFMLDLFLIVRS